MIHIPPDRPHLSSLVSPSLFSGRLLEMFTGIVRVAAVERFGDKRLEKERLGEESLSDERSSDEMS